MNKIAIGIGDKFNSPWGKGPGGGLADLVSVILSNAIVIAGIAVLFLAVGGGIAVISGGAQDRPERAAQGRQAVTSAIIGFIIIFAAYWIIEIISILVGFDILNPEYLIP